ncbi:MAG: PIN domain-containing protein [Patescibacteria group bacterium]|jgi:predicted nucleic acid-binding protein
MQKNLLDTNIIIRFLVNDDLKKVDRIVNLLKDKTSKNILLDTIIAEIIWVLLSYYSLDKKEIIEKLRALIHVHTIECNELLIERALAVWGANNISYIDAYIISVAELDNINLISYDKKLTEVSKTISREP